MARKAISRLTHYTTPDHRTKKKVCRNCQKYRCLMVALSRKLPSTVIKQTKRPCPITSQTKAIAQSAETWMPNDQAKKRMSCMIIGKKK